MKVIESTGRARDRGRSDGEALREEIRHNIAYLTRDRAEWRRRLPAFLDTLSHHGPDLLEEMQGLAEGAGVPVEDIYWLNLPSYAGELDGPASCCSNVVFADGPDGSIWGKNNDMAADDGHRHCLRIVRPSDGIPQAVFTFCGMLAVTDAMNAEGVAVGHSSVGSRFQQSDRFPPIRLWAYACLMHSRTTGEFIRRMSAVPLRGKGYNMLCVDGHGAMAAIEAPCPVVQVRWPAPGSHAMSCTNYYVSPILAEADRRDPVGKANAVGRKETLERLCSADGPFDLARMQAVLRHHGEASICRHGGPDLSRTSYSAIGLTRERRLLFMDGNPCDGEYEETSVG